MILDCQFGAIADPATLSAELVQIVGVIETGLFIGMTSLALVAAEVGILRLEPGIVAITGAGENGALRGAVCGCLGRWGQRGRVAPSPAKPAPSSSSDAGSGTSLWMT